MISCKGCCFVFRNGNIPWLVNKIYYECCGLQALKFLFQKLWYNDYKLKNTITEVKIESIDVNEAIENAKKSLESDKNISPSTKATFSLLLMLISILLNRLGLNSKNSSKPPSSDQNLIKKARKKSNKPAGGQLGHIGHTLEPVESPDEIKLLKLDKRTLPKGVTFKANGYAARQIINIKISRVITEYRAERLIDDNGTEYIAPFPPEIIRPIQYGASVKAQAVYLSSYQLIPYERTQEQFNQEYGIQLSSGSLYNFNAEAAKILDDLKFEDLVKRTLRQTALAHADETSINLNGQKIWLHNMSNDHWTWYEPHLKRGTEAMKDINILPLFSGVLVHDHWKPYYTYDCDHALCNAHHLRELTRTFEQDKQVWAEKMQAFLLALNDEVNKSSLGKLNDETAGQRRKQYQKILNDADLECPAPEQPENTKRKVKRSKSRNLLERLRDYESDVLRFMVNPLVPFTNNLGERDIRMIKIQQKISGCFRSIEGAINFCKIRSYLSTCRKNGISATDALNSLFNKKLPDFLQAKINTN